MAVGRIGRGARGRPRSSSGGGGGGGQGLLTFADMTYLGKYLLPADDPGGAKTRWGYSAGIICGRRVSGQLRLFVTGSQERAGGGDWNSVGDGLYEVTLPGTIGDRCTLVRNWGDVTQGKAVIWDTNQTHEIRGLQYLNDQLWWAYGSSYFTGFDPDPSIGVSVLNDGAGTLQAYGPWRTQDHSQKTRGYLVTVPDAFATAYTSGQKLAVGAPPTSGNAAGPRGSCLFAINDSLPLGTTPDVVLSSAWTLATQRLIYHDDAHPQERHANYKVCGWYVLYDDAQGGPLDPGTPDFNNNSLAFDTLSAAAWVKTATKEGVIFFGQITSFLAGVDYGTDPGIPHMWYGPSDHPCRHGQENGSPGTGPKSASEVPYMCIYDPANLALAAQGSVNPWGFTASSAANVDTVAAIPPHVTATYMFGGAYFDPVSSVLFVTDIGGETLGEIRPVIHAFSVV